MKTKTKEHLIKILILVSVSIFLVRTGMFLKTNIDDAMTFGERTHSYNFYHFSVAMLYFWCFISSIVLFFVVAVLYFSSSNIQNRIGDK